MRIRHKRIVFVVVVVVINYKRPLPIFITHKTGCTAALLPAGVMGCEGKHQDRFDLEFISLLRKLAVKT